MAGQPPRSITVAYCESCGRPTGVSSRLCSDFRHGEVLEAEYVPRERAERLHNLLAEKTDEWLHAKDDGAPLGRAA